MSPLIPLLALVVASATEIKPVPALQAPVSPSIPVLTQLRLDLAALDASIPALPPSALTSPQAFADLQKAMDAAARGRAPEVQTDALRRVELADQVLGRFDPNEFARLPQAEQDASLAKLWEGWKDRGLVANASAKADPGAALDRMIVSGVEDRALTSANKSTFLAVAVLGYPLEDALWLQRMRIQDAIEENQLSYPLGQRWTTQDGTPEFLGTTKEGQGLVDAWSDATELGREVVQAVKQDKEPPKGAPKAFVSVVKELAANEDDEALKYLSGQDPTFSAFLLDARKPGYYLYNGDKSIVARIMAAKAASALGVRRIDKPDGPKVHASTYFYRPARVAERLESLRKAKVSVHDEDAKRRLLEYGRRVKTLADLVK